MEYTQVVKGKLTSEPFGDVAIKLGKKMRDNEFIQMEGDLLKRLQGIEGIPKVYFTGVTQNNK